VRRVDREVGLAVEPQRPAGQSGRPAAPPESLDELAGPEVLVYIYAQGILPISAA
jgi:hypothetical protein